MPFVYQTEANKMLTVKENATLLGELLHAHLAPTSLAAIKRALDPMRSFHLQLQEEIESYERLKRGEFDEIQNFEGLGRLLVALRISQGVSQRELAERLEVHESQVSRDERNEYRGVTLERANRILEALQVELISSVVSVGDHGARKAGSRVPA